MPPGEEVQVPKLSEVCALDHVAFTVSQIWTMGICLCATTGMSMIFADEQP